MSSTPTSGWWGGTAWVVVADWWMGFVATPCLGAWATSVGITSLWVIWSVWHRLKTTRDTQAALQAVATAATTPMSIAWPDEAPLHAVGVRVEGDDDDGCAADLFGTSAAAHHRTTTTTPPYEQVLGIERGLARFMDTCAASYVRSATTTLEDRRRP